jgi:hypothetical protein
LVAADLPTVQALFSWYQVFSVIAAACVSERAATAP